METSVATLLMFEGKAGAAMELYASLFPQFRVIRIEKYGPEAPGVEGTIKRADLDLAGHRLVFTDTPVKHEFTFTPSISIYVDCEDEADLERKFQEFSMDGKVYMPLADYGFSTRFGWVADRFGVSWQLNLP